MPRSAGRSPSRPRRGRFEHPNDTVLVALTVTGVAPVALLPVLVLAQF